MKHTKPVQRYRGSAFPTSKQPQSKRHHLKKIAVICLLVVAIVGLWLYWPHKVEAPTTKSAKVITQTTQTGTTGALSTTTTTSPPPNACASNSLSQLILVSIKQQHLWACSGTTQSYDSAVVTGMELYPADLTPTGTYHIYAKETNQTLTGHDSTGSWSDPVSYWMPFLDNQYGEYGFHDATWRAPSDFGNINIYNPYTTTEHGSHGCVELPLATAKWLYGWAPIGTAVTVES